MNTMRNNLLVLAGAVIGGLIGHFAFLRLTHHGYYGLVLPGGLAGLGAGVFKSRSVVISICCGILSLGFGIYSEWRYAPFLDDNSLSYFLIHLSQLSRTTLIMIALGGIIGFWVPFRRRSLLHSSER